jgi:hypothetical protein
VRFLYRTANAKDSPQSIARIDRTARKVDICRTFMRMIAAIVPPADERLSTAVLCTDRIPTVQEPGDLQLFRSLSDSCGRCGRYLAGYSRL